MTEATDADDIKLQHRAARLAARAQIRDVRLLRTSAQVHHQPRSDGGLTYDIEFTPAVDADPTATSSFVVRLACRLHIQDRDSAKPDDSSEAARTGELTVATAEFEYAGLFEYILREDDAHPSDDEFVAYASTTGRFALYPYIREYVYDLTGRFALPALTLEVLSRPLPTPPDTSTEKSL